MMLMVNECRGEGQRWMENVVSQARPEGTLDAERRETLCGGSVSAFSARADYGPPKELELYKLYWMFA